MATDAIAPPAPTVLSDALIEACGERAATYDRENRFFTEDFEALRAAGYLNALVPREFGGLGLSLADLCREQSGSPIARRQLPWRSTCTCTGSVSRASSARWATRRWNGC